VPAVPEEPWTRRLIGAAGPALSDAEVWQQYREYLEQKYA
jgi:hypothetical protein